MLDDAELYERLHTGTPGDLELYVRACSGAARVLELGSGAGRVATCLARNLPEISVTGLELDPALLARAQTAIEALPAETRARVQMVQGDMRKFRFSEPFDRILLPYNGLYCLGGATAALACFRACADQLTPEGELWLDVYSVDAFHAEAPSGDEAPEDDDEPVARIEIDGQLLDVLERSSWLRDQQELRVTYEVRGSRNQIIGRQQLTHHYLTSPEVFELLDTAGFEVAAAWGDFEGAPFDEDTDHLIVVAEPKR